MNNTCFHKLRTYYIAKRKYPFKKNVFNKNNINN